MATTREEVVVDLKVNAKGVDNIDSGIQQTAESATNLSASIGSVTASLGALIGTVVKTSFHMRLFNTLNLKGVTVFGDVQNVTKRMTGSQDKLVKQISGKSIPSFAKLAKVAGAVGAAVLAAAVAFKAWTLSMSATQEGSEGLATTLTAFDQVTRDVVDSLAESPQVMNAFFNSILGGLALIIPGFHNLIQLVAEQEESAKNLTIAQRENIDAQLERLDSTAERRKLISEIQTELTKENLTLAETIDLTEQLGRLQAEEATSRVDEIGFQIAALEHINAEVEKNFDKRRQNDIKMAELTLQRELMLQKNQEILDRTDIRVESIRQGWEDVNDEIDELVGKDPLKFFGDETGQFLDQGKSLLDVFTDIQQEFEQDLADGFDAVEELEEEHIETRSAAQEKAARRRIAWEELGVAGQLQLGAQLLSASADIAQENFELQKGFKIGEVVVNTAAALVRLWSDGGPLLAPYLTPIVVAQGVAAIASIQGAEPGQSGNVVNPTITRGANFAQQPIESASNTFFQQNRTPSQVPQTVLVTEDLNTVQSRVVVTEDRASIG